MKWRQPLECGGLDAAFQFLDRSRNWKAASRPPHSKGSASLIYAHASLYLRGNGLSPDKCLGLFRPKMWSTRDDFCRQTKSNQATLGHAAVRYGERQRPEHRSIGLLIDAQVADAPRTEPAHRVSRRWTGCWERTTEVPHRRCAPS